MRRDRANHEGADRADAGERYDDRAASARGGKWDRSRVAQREHEVTARCRGADATYVALKSSGNRRAAPGTRVVRPPRSTLRKRFAGEIHARYSPSGRVGEGGGARAGVPRGRATYRLTLCQAAVIRRA